MSMRYRMVMFRIYALNACTMRYIFQTRENARRKG